MQNQGSILIIIFIYFIEALETTGGVLSWTTVYVLIFHPFSFLLSQIILTVCWSTATAAFVLISAVSVFKILFVTHFDLVFSQDPDVLGKKVLMVSLLLGCIPHGLICIYQSTNGIVSTPAVAFLAGESSAKVAAPLMQFYALFWFIFYLFMLIFTILFIPFYLNKSQGAVISAELSQRKENIQKISLSRMIYGATVAVICLLAAIINFGMPVERGLPIQTPLAVLTVTCMLLFHVFENNTWNYGKKQAIAFYQDMLKATIQCKSDIRKLKPNRVDAFVESDSLNV